MSDELTGQNVCIAVLGGTGFVGQHLAQTWNYQHQPVELRWLVHRSRSDWMRTVAHDIRDVNLDDARSLASAIDGCTVLINLLRPSGNGWLAATLARALPTISSKVRALVHASSIDVYGAAPDTTVTETTLPKPHTPYAHEHLRLESLVAEAAVSSSILRLGAVFGPGGRNLHAMADSVAREGDWKLAMRRALNGKRRMHLVSVETVAEVLRLVVRHPCGVGGEILLVTEDQEVDNNFAFVQERFANAFGRRIPDLGHLPPAVLRSVSQVRRRGNFNPFRRYSGERLAMKGFAPSEPLRVRIDRYASILAAPPASDRQ